MEKNKEVLDLLCSSADTLREKKEINKKMNEVFKNVAGNVGVASDRIRKTKDYVYYEGRGMSDPLTVDKEQKEKFKDRVSPTFIKLLEIVENCVAFGYEDLLEKYTDALAERGISLTVDKSVIEPLTEESIEMVKHAVDSGCSLQKDICDCADQIKDVDSETAEALDFVKKGDYKKVAEFFENKDSNKDVEKKYTEESKRLDMLGEAYQSIFYDTLTDANK